MAERAPTVGPDIGIEASDGIRSAPDALAMIAAGGHADTSSGVAIVGELRQAG